eukprot:TRINITY_DN406_c0_g2_i2.p1 TRINITY_DN406_c0_g2~~TRINITY_DN406_c0_g2_i2.p1  ORF type:complete len:347 (+),score=27.11 TRINITY_DN406_c0_g2_i2:263-1303(+)
MAAQMCVALLLVLGVAFARPALSIEDLQGAGRHLLQYNSSAAIAAAAAAVPNGGICSTDYVTFTAATEADLYKRLLYPSTQSVVIYVTVREIPLSGALNMSTGWSCTTIRSAVSGVVAVFSRNTDSSPVVFVWATNHVFFYGIGFSLPTTPDSVSCTVLYSGQYLNGIYYPQLLDYNGRVTCAALHIWGSYHVEMHAGTTYGRVDVLRSNRVIINSCNLFTPGRWPYDEAPYIKVPGVVRFMSVGDPLNLVRSNNIVMNSEISGCEVGVILMGGAAGVTVRNNYIHNFSFSAIQCGQNVGNVADCMLMTFAYNYIITEPGVVANNDGAGIYFDTHWANPGKGNGRV